MRGFDEEKIITSKSLQEEMNQERKRQDKSKLADQINEGKYGIENMDYKYLADDLIENEAALF